MTRKEAQKEALNSIDERIAIEGENAIALMAPQPGKNSWTWKEFREAVINDIPLDGTNTNLIDDVLAIEKWKKNVKNMNV